MTVSISRQVRVVSLAAFVAVGASAIAEESPDWAPVGEILGKAGERNKDGSYKVTLLRTDVSVKTAAGMPVPAAMGLNSYAAFAGTPARATVVGDTCMLPHEVNPVIDALRAGGLDVVSLHNHILGAEPQTVFLHFQGHGEALALARVVRAAFDQLGKSALPVPPLRPDAKAIEPDWKAISDILGRAGPPAKDGVYKVTLPRADLDARLDGRTLPPGVGLACWAAFYACPCGKTMVMGDTCVRRAELQPALDAMRRGGIGITSIHNHVLGEDPNLMFMHIEAEGDALALARAIRAAWDTLPVAAATPAKPAGAATLDFDAMETGKPPADFTTALTGGGGPATWEVREDATAPSPGKVLAQTGADDTDYRFPLCVYDKLTARDVAVSVQFKAVAGKVDQAAGLVARYRDADNYYITRANALEDNIRLYKVVDGKRRQFAGTNVKVSSGEWHSLRLLVKGGHFEVFFNGKLQFEADDDTFKDTGRIGVWTKADSVTHFDDVRVESLDGR